MKSKRTIGSYAPDRRSRIFNTFATSRWNRNSDPKIQTGERFGKFVVTGHESYSAVNPRTNKMMSKEHNWYKCICDCGNTAVRSQQELTDTRREQQCNRCQRNKIAADRKAKKDQPQPTEEAV